MAHLQSWSRQKFGDKKAKLEQLKKRLVEMKFNGKQYEEGAEILLTERHIQNLQMDEEIYWRQKSRVEWLKEGDKNTKFFHSKASTRKKKTRIWGAMNNQNRWVEDGDEVVKQFCDYIYRIVYYFKPYYKSHFNCSH